MKVRVLEHARTRQETATGGRMNVFVLGLDGATWDILGPLTDSGDLPNLARLMKQGASGVLKSVFPPLSPVAWTAVMTGKNSGKHGVYEFLEHEHDPLGGRVSSSRSIRSDLVWEIAGRHGLKTVAGGVPLSYPLRECPGFTSATFSALLPRPTSPATPRCSPSWNAKSALIALGPPPCMTAVTRRKCSPI